MDALEIEKLTGETIADADKAKASALATYVLALIGHESGRQFVPGAVSWVVKVHKSLIVLDQPIVVEKVESLCGQPLDWEPFDKTGATQQLRLNGNPYRFPNLARVEGAIPAEDLDKLPLVKQRVAQIVLRTLRINPAAASGVSQMSKTAGRYTQQATFASFTVGGDLILSKDDLRFCKSLRKKLPNSWMV